MSGKFPSLSVPLPRLSPTPHRAILNPDPTPGSKCAAGKSLGWAPRLGASTLRVPSCAAAGALAKITTVLLLLQNKSSLKGRTGKFFCPPPPLVPLNPSLPACLHPCLPPSLPVSFSPRLLPSLPSSLPPLPPYLKQTICSAGLSSNSHPPAYICEELWSQACTTVPVLFRSYWK